MQINNSQDLDAAIIELEKRKVIQESILKEQFHAVKESMKPLNMIKRGFSKLTHTPEIRDGVFKTVAGVGIGLLTKNTLLGKTIPLVKSLFGEAVENSVDRTVKTGADTIKAYGTAIYNNLFGKKTKKF
ncbi:MAG: hypothetical protein WKF35_01355 [Ferruginibacter sp.]